MNAYLRVVGAVILIFGIGVGGAFPAAASEGSRTLGLRDRILLQATMQTYVQDRTSEGVFSYRESNAGQLYRLQPVTMHDLIVDTGEFYVLCFDFRDEDGAPVELDFYIGTNDTPYAVAQVHRNERSNLFRMLDEGKAWLFD